MRDYELGNSDGSNPTAVAVVRAIAAVLEDAIRRDDHDVARDLAEQLADELRRYASRPGP